MIMIIWLTVTAVIWAVVTYRLCLALRADRGYRDVEAEREDLEDAACAWVLMWVLSGWLPCGAWVIISRFKYSAVVTYVLPARRVPRVHEKRETLWD